MLKSLDPSSACLSSQFASSPGQVEKRERSNLKIFQFHVTSLGNETNFKKNEKVAKIDRMLFYRFNYTYLRL